MREILGQNCPPHTPWPNPQASGLNVGKLKRKQLQHILDHQSPADPADDLQKKCSFSFQIQLSWFVGVWCFFGSIISKLIQQTDAERFLFLIICAVDFISACSSARNFWSAGNTCAHSPHSILWLRNLICIFARGLIMKTLLKPRSFGKEKRSQTALQHIFLS